MTIEEFTPAIEAVAPAPREPAWGFPEIALVVLAFVASVSLCGLAGYSLVMAFLRHSGQSAAANLATNPLFLVPVQAAAYLITFAVLSLTVTLRSHQRFWKAICWEMPAIEPALAYAFTGVALALGVQFISAFMPIPKALPIHEYFREPRFAYAMVVFGLVVAPFAEEIFFRGLLYPVLLRTTGRLAGTVITASAFALLHETQLARAWAPLVLLFGVGLVLTWIRARANSVAASWIIHVSYNATLFGILFYFSNGFLSLSH